MNEVVISCRAALPDGRNSKSILKKVELDSDVLAIFRGAGKEGAFADWVKTNYPGYVYAPNSGGIKQPADVGMESYIKKRAPKKSHQKSNKESKSSSLSISSFFPSLSLFKNSRSSSSKNDEKPSRKVKRLENKIEAAELKEELRQVKRLSRENKINELNESVEEKGKNLFYYFRYGWIFLDSPWKKAVTVIFVLALLGSGYQFLSDKITFSDDYELFKNEHSRLKSEKATIDSLVNVNNKERVLLMLSEFKWKLKTHNQFLSDSVRNKEKYWRTVKNSIRKKINNQ